MSTFAGLEMSKRALFAQQGALHTTGHNISNVNTEGYSRQRVDFQTTTPFQMPARMMSSGAGQKGTGVEIGVIERIRNHFLDAQYRSENSSMGYWETRQGALSRMEELLNEPTENGLQKTMDKFWQSLEDLSTNPDNDGARAVVAQRGLAVAETFNSFSRDLKKIKDDLKEEIGQSAKNINGLLNDINEINKQVKKIEPHGQLANDLYDERDRLIDELSEYVNIKVEYKETSPSALDVADGIAEIELVDEKGDPIGDGGVKLLTKDDTNGEEIKDRVKFKNTDNKGNFNGSRFEELTVGNYFDSDGKIDPELDQKIDNFDDLQRTGSLAALIQSYGYKDSNEETKGDYPEMLKNLDDMALKFAKEFNKVHRDGEHANKDTSGSYHFFKTTNEGEDDYKFTAENITVNQKILDDGSLIAASTDSDGQNGKNAQKLANVFDTKMDIGEKKGTTVSKFYNAVIGEVGVNGQEAKRNVENTEILREQINDSRKSTSSVSLDEEITNLVKFQHAYNAAARNMTTIDETLDRIINNMGLVGR